MVNKAFFDEAAELACKAGSVVDWNAISAVATVAAVIAALLISGRDQRLRRKEQLRAEAKAARIVSSALGSPMAVMPNVVESLRASRGEVHESPGVSVIYGLDACQEILKVESYIHSLPLDFLSSGTFVVYLANSWIRDIEVRRQDQQNHLDLDVAHEWDPQMICSIGEQLIAEGTALKDQCRRFAENVR